MKLTFVFFAIAICATLAIGLWLSFASPLVTEEQLVEVGAVPATPATMPEQIAGRASLASLRNQTEALECEFRFNDEAGEGQGNSFVADGQLRVDTLYTMVDGTTTVSSFILTDATTYVWTEADGERQAMSFPTHSSTMDFEAAAADETGQLINPEETVQYTCVPWEVDNSVFVPPAGLEFIDLGVMMEGVIDREAMVVPR